MTESIKNKEVSYHIRLHLNHV